MDWAGIWESIKNFFTNNYIGIIKFFAVLVLGIILIKLFLNIVKRIMSRTKMEKVTQSFLYGILKFCLYLLLILTLLSTLGISISGIITALSALVLAIGMALQSNISNLAKLKPSEYPPSTLSVYAIHCPSESFAEENDMIQGATILLSKIPL